jgi:hypothetical protein
VGQFFPVITNLTNDFLPAHNTGQYLYSQFLLEIPSWRGFSWWGFMWEKPDKEAASIVIIHMIVMMPAAHFDYMAIVAQQQQLSAFESAVEAVAARKP